MTIEFPQELIEEIIDHLAGDFRSLKACSLVSRAWVFRCRSHLFKRCTLVGPMNILVFRDLLQSPRCTLLPHVCSIEAQRYDGTRDDACFDQIAADLRRLTKVRVLEMKLLIVRTASVDALEVVRTGFITAFPKITRLVLTLHFVFTSRQPVPLIEMICLFPALQELDIYEMSGTLMHPSADAVPPQGLRSLWLCENSVDAILAWLHASNHLPNVDSLSLPTVAGRFVSTVRAAMQQLGSAILHLDIDVAELLRLSTVAFDLSLYPNLQHLVIRDYSFDLPDPNRMFPLINTLAAPALEHLALHLDLSVDENLNWAVLDKLLCPTRSPRLRSVHLRCTRHLYHNHDGHDFLRGALPSLSAVLRTEW